MPIVQATVPQAHLATAMGAPNELVVEYSTDILLPVPGPYLLTRIRTDFVRALMLVNDFMVFLEEVAQLLATGDGLQLPPVSPERALELRRNGRGLERDLQEAARHELAQMAQRKRATARGVTGMREADSALKESVLRRLAAPNLVFHELYEQQLLSRSASLVAPRLLQGKTFAARLEIVLGALLASRERLLPRAITAATLALQADAMRYAAERQPGYLREAFDALPKASRAHLAQWMVVHHLGGAQRIPDWYWADLTPLLGFGPSGFVNEWALTRRERMRLVFGTPDLRGPLGAEPVGPSGTFRREDYSAVQQELSVLTGQARQERRTEATGISVGTLRRRLDAVYYAGTGSLNQLTSQASNSLLLEERREVVTAMMREVSESREQSILESTVRATATTVTREALGVDPRLAATHHRFRVVVPVDTTVEMYDVGLTWSPRVTNPGFALRRAIRDVRRNAYRAFRHQYYVPEPVAPRIVWDTDTVTKHIFIDDSTNGQIHRDFSITLASTEGDAHPNFNAWSAKWESNDSFWNDDPDHVSIELANPAFSGGVISGTVILDSDEGNFDWEGSVKISVPVLRYSQDTVNAMVQHEIELRDYQLKRQALEAQARQYAAIKEREFIERHEAREPMLKLVFYELVRRVCVPWLAPHISYYKEILWRCIDWQGAKMDFEPAQLDALSYPEFPADHLTNASGVRLFLPVHKGAETNFFDVLSAVGTAAVRASAEAALNHITAIRAGLAANGSTTLDQFTTAMTIGEHIEAVMSNHDLAL